MTPRRVYVRPTKRQRQLLAAYIATGSFEGAAGRLGIEVTTAYRSMAAMRARTGLSTGALCYLGALHGWLVVQELGV